MLLNACKDIGLAKNIVKIKYMEVGNHRSMMENKQITIASNSREKVKILKYLGSFLNTQNYFHEEIACKLKAENSYYCSHQILLVEDHRAARPYLFSDGPNMYNRVVL